MPRRLAALLLFLGWSLALSGAASGDLASQVQALYRQGEYAQAVALAETAAAPTADLIFYHGLSLARLERFERAQTVFQRGRRRFPQDKRFALELAGVAYRLKRLEEAKSLLRKALTLDPADEYGNEFLGSLYLLEGNLGATLKYWNRINKPLIQDVTLTPPPSLHTVLRERAVAISGGQILTLERLRTTESHLDRLGIFARRQFELKSRSDQRYDLTIRLLPIEPPLAGWPGRLLPIARSLPYQAVEFDQYNLASRAINFQSLWRWDSNKRRIDLELAGPIRLKPRLRYRLGLDARDENWDLTTFGPSAGEQLDNLKLKKIALGGDFVFAFSEKLEWSSGLWFAVRGYRNDDGGAAFADSWSFEERNQLTYRVLDLPERRIQVDSAARLRTGRVVTGAPSRFAIVEGDLAGSWKPRIQRDAWQAHARLRAGKTYGRIPFDEFFQLGMERDNDLWLRGHVGTRNGIKGNAPLGTDYALLQTEVDRSIWEYRFLRLRAGPFVDAGWIAGPAPRFGSHGGLLDTGLQAKLSVAGGFTWSFVYGRDLRGGQGVFYTAVRY